MVIKARCSDVTLKIILLVLFLSNFVSNNALAQMPCDDVDIYLEKIFLEGRTYVKLEEKNVTVEDFPFKYVKLRLNDKEVVYYISCKTGEIYTPKVGMEYKIYFNLTTEGENKTEVPAQQNVQPTQLITDSGNNTYIVIFREWTPNNREQVLSVKGVTYVTDTTFGNQGYPAIIISSNQSTANRIKEYNFIVDVQPVVMAPDVMPKSETKMTTGLPVLSVIFLILFVWWIKRRD